MLFPEGSSLVARLSDAIKDSLENLKDMSSDAIEQFEPYREAILAAQQQVAAALADGTVYEPATIPTDECVKCVATARRIHGHTLTTILLCCFTLEAYINSLAHYFIFEHDGLGLIRSDHRKSAEVLFDGIERKRVRDKWQTVAHLGSTSGFDRSRSPWQEFDILFKFRDDYVHDKVTQYSADRSTKRYQNRFPDPLGGCLDLKHALFASMTYWAMVQHVHDKVGVPREKFHRHYNLMPWRDPNALRDLQEVADRYHNWCQPKHA